jgi:hypothetical protein
MVLDVVQLLCVTAIIVGIWVFALASAPIGVATILSGMVLLAVALTVEHRTT